VTTSPLAKAHWETADRVIRENEPDPGDPLARALRVARAQREACRSIEEEWATSPDLRQPFSRNELRKNRRFPFL